MIDPTYPTNKKWHEAQQVMCFTYNSQDQIVDAIYSKCIPYCHKGVVGVWNGENLIETKPCSQCGKK